MKRSTAGTEHRWALWLLIAAALVLSQVPAPAVLPWTLAINTNNVIVATNPAYGAVGDGVTDNTLALSNAIAQAARGGLTNGLSGGIVELPAPGVYVCGPLKFSNYVGLQVDAGAVLRLLPLNRYPGTDVSPAHFLSGSKLHDVAVLGQGAIDGQGLAWWKDSETNAAAVRPNLVNFSSCSRVLLQDITCSNSPSPFVSIKGNGGNVTLQRVKIYAPASSAPVNPSHNTDGLDLAETNGLIADCLISTGDDNIAMGSSASVSRDILVTNCVFGDGHGCSIGSYTYGGVSNLTVINCSFNGTDNGIRLKSQRGRGGVVQNCNYYNLTMTNVDWPLLIYSYYEYGLGTLTGVTPAFAATTAATNPTTLNSTTPIWRNITFSNITATVPNGRPPLMVWGLPEAPASNLVFRAVNISSSSTKIPGLYNTTNLQFIDCSFSPPAGVKTVQFWNVDITFTNSSPVANLLQLDGLTTNGLGNSLKFFNAQAALGNTNAIAGAPLTLSASTLTVNNRLALSPATVLNYVLGTNPATLAVAGNLALGGMLNVAAGPGFTNGAYTLMTYIGALNGALPALGSAPAGCRWTFDTNTPGVVNLVAMPLPSNQPINLLMLVTGNQLQLSWPPDHLGWRLQIQTNALSVGLGTNWTTVPNSINISSTNLTIDPANGAVFLRLVYP